MTTGAAPVTTKSGMKRTTEAFRYGRDHLTEDHYRSFFADRETLCWEDAMTRLLSREDFAKPQKIPTFLSDGRRNDFIFLLPITPQSTVLDFGTGWGNTRFTLAQYCKRVVAMEPDRDRLRFAAQHFQHPHRSKIAPVCAGKGQFLPFADATFDAVVMNGVLEYTPYSAAGSPRAEAIYASGLSLPSSVTLSDSEIEQICEMLVQFLS